MLPIPFARLFAVLVFFISFQNCGGSGGGGGKSTSSAIDSSSLIPDSLVVVSVTSEDSSSSSNIASPRRVPSALDYDSERESIVDRLAQTTVEGCLADLSAPSVVNTTVTCYGPRLFVKYHPDSSSATATQLPEGDLGIWTSTEESTGEACSSAKANALVDTVGGLINGNLEILAGMACAAEVTGVALSTVGDTADLADTINAEVADTTLTTATVRFLRENTTTGTKSYLTTLEGTFAGTTLSISLSHTFTASDGTSSGRLYGWVEGVDAVDSLTKRTGYSIVYDEDESSVTYVFRSMKSGEVTATAPTFFNSSGDVDFSEDGFGSDANYGRAEIDISNGLGTLYFAWQASSSDGYSRVFQIEARESTSGGEDEASSYFGFGPDIDSTDDASLSGMICNWAGPGNNRTLNTELQAQVMERNPANGLFEPSQDYTEYAPTNNCDHTATTPDFQYSSEESGTYANFGTILNDLVAYGDSRVGTIPEVAEPVYEDGDALVVAAQGLYSQISGIVGEMQTLAESSADSSTSEETRFTNQEDIDEKIDEITVIAGNSEFASRLILQGTDPSEIPTEDTETEEMTFEYLEGSYWNKILDAVNALASDDQSITFTYSFVQTGTLMERDSSGVTASAVELMDWAEGSVTHDEYKEEIRGAMALWEELFERVFSTENGFGHNLTMNFEDLGEETGTSTASNLSAGLYEIPGTENLGNLRFGMMEFGNLVVAGPGSPTANDTAGYDDASGDIHFGKAIDWRQDHETITRTGNASVMVVAGHELGHGWGLEHDMTSTEQMMNTNNSLSESIHELFPDGLYESASSDKNGIAFIYGSGATRVEPGAYTFADGSSVDLPAVGPAALGISAAKVRNTREAEAAITRFDAALSTLETYQTSISVAR